MQIAATERIHEDKDKPDPKKRPGPYSRLRPITAYASYADASSGSADATVAADSSDCTSGGLQPEQPTEAPPGHLLAIEYAVGFAPGFDPEPMLVHMAEGEAGWATNLEFLAGCGEKTMQMLDQVASEVFYPVPGCFL